MKKEFNMKKVTIADFSEYESGRSSNGGCYAYFTYFNRLENGLFEVSYGTSAEFEYCPVCGNFANHAEYDREEDILTYSCGDFETITEAELRKIIDSANADENLEVNIQYDIVC